MQDKKEKPLPPIYKCDRCRDRCIIHEGFLPDEVRTKPCPECTFVKDE